MEEGTGVCGKSFRLQGSSVKRERRRKIGFGRESVQLQQSSEEMWARSVGSPRQCWPSRGVLLWAETASLQNTLLSHCLGAAQWQHSLGINAVADPQEVAVGAAGHPHSSQLVLLKIDLAGAFPWLPQPCTRNQTPLEETPRSQS